MYSVCYIGGFVDGVRVSLLKFKIQRDVDLLICCTSTTLSVKFVEGKNLLNLLVFQAGEWNY